MPVLHYSAGSCPAPTSSNCFFRLCTQDSCRVSWCRHPPTLWPCPWRTIAQWSSRSSWPDTSAPSWAANFLPGPSVPRSWWICLLRRYSGRWLCRWSDCSLWWPSFSPQELRGRILIKAKKQNPHLSQLGTSGSYASFSSSSEDEQAGGSKNTPKKDPAKVNT